MKRLILSLIVVAGTIGAFAATTPAAQAGLFGGSKSTPSPSPSPSALPTASPEPPNVAIPRLEAKLKANPNDQQSLGQLDAEFLQINRPDLAVQISHHLLQVGDKTAQVYYFDGVAMSQLGQDAQATYDLEQASNLDPTNMGVLAQLAEEYLKQNRPADAERVAKRAATFNKTEPAALMTLGSVYASEQKYDDARAAFEQAFALSPKDTSPIYQIATTYAQQNNIPMAIQSINRALMIDPKSVQALVYKADLFAKQHDDAQTSAAYDDAVVAAASDDEKALILERKASYFITEKKYPQGEAILQQVITQYPKIATGFVAYGTYYASQRQTDKAVAKLQQALQIDPNNGPALLTLGEISMETGHASDSINYLKKYSQVSPDAQGFALLGQAYSQTHNYTGARDSCSRSFEIQRSPETLGCVAGADYELHNYKEASKIFDVLDKNAHGFLDQNPTLLYIAAKSYQSASQCTKAVAAYKRLLPMMKKGTKDYANVQKYATSSCNTSSTSKHGH
ncbi:MAG TPA: tetratricopeptide repeat protein [Candidatus Tumulicola sp.]|jgi:tetratricopeptide (TPR) repeat protein